LNTLARVIKTFSEFIAHAIFHLLDRLFPRGSLLDGSDIHEGGLIGRAGKVAVECTEIVDTGGTGCDEGCSLLSFLAKCTDLLG
jgi:hypothetical protein